MALPQNEKVNTPAGKMLGLQFSEEYAMLTCFETAMREPETVPLAAAAGADSVEDPLILPVPEEVWKAAKGQGEPIEKLRDFLGKCLDCAATPQQRAGLHLMVTVPKLDRLLSERLPQALELLGLTRRQIYLQDFLTGFYYYAVNQRRDLWNADVALLEYRDEVMYGYVMHIDRAKVPAVVTVRQAARQSVTSRERDGRDAKNWDRERDRLLFELLKKVFEGRNVQTVYIVGDYYSADWAERSFQYLCGGRHAFQGRNLYTQGACYAAMERAGALKMGDMLFVGDDVVSDNLGMVMRIRGKNTYYPLVTAGINWYEAHHECEFIMDDETQISIYSKPMLGGNETVHILQLDHFPDRPPRASRLKLMLYFVSPHVCVLEVEDKGFGGFYKSTNRRWKRKIYL